jgi:Holliday junction resolvase RusA-like endonuclease
MAMMAGDRDELNYLMQKQPSGTVHVLDERQEYVLRFDVFGLPAPQGSKKFVGMMTSKKTGRSFGAMAEMSRKKLNPWRKACAAAAKIAHGNRPALDGALVGRVVFTMQKPKSAPKTRRTWPNKTPDLSKLLRALEDALVQAEVIADDARIVGYERLFKVFPGEDPDALSFTTGARIEFRVIDGSAPRGV